MHGSAAAVVVLDADTPARPDLGGKGAALARLVRRQSPVPDVAVVSTSAYRRLLADPTLDEFLARVAEAPHAPDAAEVDAAFLAVPVPDDLAAEIAAAAARLGPEVAVRSSASAEDLADRSFAGQYRSLLGVATRPDEVLRAVRLVWASLWHPAPWSYRRAWGVRDDDVAMAVVLMAMVPATEAGVVFTVDPGGEPGRVRVESVAGLGEALVSGEATPDVWMVPRDADAALPDGAPVHLGELRDLALAIEQAEGVPQDVEWAHDGTTTWIVQARPITVDAATGDGFDDDVDDHEVTTAGIGEMLPGVLPPLRWEVNALLVEEAFRATLHQLGAMGAPSVLHRRFIRRIRGRAVLDLDLLKEVAEGIPGGNAAEIERQYFGIDIGEPPPAVGRVRRLVRDLRTARARRQSLDEAVLVDRAVTEILDLAPPVTALDDAALLAYRLRLIDLAVRAMTAELAVAAIAGAAYTALEQVLAADLGPEAAANRAQAVTRGAGLPPPPRGMASQSVFAGPTWDEVGGPPPATIAHDVADLEQARDALAAELGADERRRRRRLLTGQVIDVRVHLVRRLIADAVADLATRERTKAAVLALGGVVRTVHLELGRRLVARRAISAVDDVELLSTRELLAALDGQPPPPALLDRRRRWVATCVAAGPLPERFTGAPEAAPIEVPDGHLLHGRAASPGRTTARAQVLGSSTEDFVDGSVLVAAATDASWTPLFLRASGIVVERGGPLSHAAIVARELGLPAVLAVHGATARLDGVEVTVDGTAGMVVIHEEAVA